MLYTGNQAQITTHGTTGVTTFAKAVNAASGLNVQAQPLVVEHATQAARINLRSTAGRSWELTALTNADTTDPGCLSISEVNVRRRVLLDSAGRVRIPNQPAMIATRGNAFYETFAAGSQNGLLGQFTLNRGGFTAGGNVNGALVVHVPLTGVYLIVLRAYVQANSSGRLYLSRNNAHTALFIQPDNAGVDRSVEATGLLSLTAGDYLGFNVAAARRSPSTPPPATPRCAPPSWGKTT